MTSCSQRYLCLRCVCDPVVDSILPSSPFSVWLLVVARGPSVIGLPTWRTDRDGPGFPSPAPWASQEACSQCLLGMPRPTGGYLTGTRLVSPAPSGAPVTPPPACAPPPSPGDHRPVLTYSGPFIPVHMSFGTAPLAGHPVLSVHPRGGTCQVPPGV